MRKNEVFRTNIHQVVDMTIKKDVEDRINSLTECCLSRSRLKQCSDTVIQMQKFQFASTNSSLGWIGTSAYHFCSFFASYLHQKAHETCVTNIIKQIDIARKLT